jgi:transposase
LSHHLIAIGCDSSKGRIDVEIRNDHGTVLFTGAFDDTPDDHQRMQRIIDDLRERFPDARIVAGIESTGGLERNWLAFFRREKRWTKCLRVFHLNAAAVHAFRSADLHRAPGDQAAASAIARFLLERCATRMPQAETDSGPVVFYRTIRALCGERIAACQRLQTLLVPAQPDLVRFCRYGIPDWVLSLLERYPTAAQLARARPATIDAIPHIDATRAAELVENAKRSVASLTDLATGATIRLLVARLRATQASIEAAQEELLTLIHAEPTSRLATSVALLDGIPGIAPWSAACLACEIGDPARFAHAKALIAWAGLDPITAASGDERHASGISHRGNAHVRAILFPLAMAGILHNPVLKAFYQRLTTTNGKTHIEALVAVMGKLLRIAHALLLSGKPFDPNHEAKRREQAVATEHARSHEAPSVDVVAPPRTDAPITKREAMRRKKAAALGAQVRDQGPKRVPEREPQEPYCHATPSAKG